MLIRNKIFFVKNMILRYFGRITVFDENHGSCDFHISVIFDCF